MANITNNSTNAVNKNMIIPDVYAELVREKIKGKVVISQSAKVVKTLVGKPGETVSMPKWAYIGDAKDITVGTAMDKTALKQTNTTATIKMVAAPAVSVNDYDDVVEFGNALDEASKQQAISLARKLDTDCIAVALTTPLKSKLATKQQVTFDEMNAILGLYGDDANAEDFAGIYIHSAFVPSFLKMDGFVDKTKTFTADGTGVMQNNLLGYFRGIPVLVTDRLYDTVKHEGYILTVKKDSIGLIPKEAPFVEPARDASTRTTTVYCSEYYAVALIDDSGVVLAQSTIEPTVIDE